MLLFFIPLVQKHGATANLLHCLTQLRCHKGTNPTPLMLTKIKTAEFPASLRSQLKPLRFITHGLSRAGIQASLKQISIK